MDADTGKVVLAAAVGLGGFFQQISGIAAMLLPIISLLYVTLKLIQFLKKGKEDE